MLLLYHCNRLQQLETDLENEKKQSIDVKTRSQNFDHKLRSLKIRLQESDNKTKDFEQKYIESEKKIRYEKHTISVSVSYKTTLLILT